MNISMSTTIKGKSFEDIGKDTKRLLSAVVRKAAFDVEREAKQNAPVDTGALKASIYVSTKGKSDYAKASADAKAIQPKAEIFPEEKAQEELEAIIGVGVDYGEAVEHGTTRQRAQPYMTPAVEKIRPQFEKAVEKVLESVV